MSGRLRLFPGTAFSVPFRYGIRMASQLDSGQVSDARFSTYLPPVLVVAPPVLLVDDNGYQEWLNEASVAMHLTHVGEHALHVMEIPISHWHSRDVQFLRFYFRHIEPARLGLVCPTTGEPAWRGALKEILSSTWLQRFLRQKTAGDGSLTNAILSQLVWYQASQRTIAKYKGKIGQACSMPIASPPASPPAMASAVVSLADHRAKKN